MAYLTNFLRCAVKTPSSAKPIVQASGASAFKSHIRLLSSPKQDVCFLNLDGGRKIAYRKLEPSDPRKPTLVFVPGFMSTMEGFKATMLDTLCKEQGVGYVRSVTSIYSLHKILCPFIYFQLWLWGHGPESWVFRNCAISPLVWGRKECFGKTGS